MEINGRKMHCVNGQYVYVFQWVNGEVLDWNDVKLIIDLESMDYECLDAFVAACQREYGALCVNWRALSGAGFGWLEYNVKRALMIECEDEEERRLGSGEVHNTLGRIVYYASVRDELVKRLSAV